LTEWLGWDAAVAQITPFVLSIANDEVSKFQTVGEEFLQPLYEAMEMEGYYNLKPACFDDEEINPILPTCW